MRILVSNDDGINAPGLWDLVAAVRPLGEVLVSAPDRDQSGAGASMTFHRPLQALPCMSRIEGVAAFAVDGTPGDSVVLAIQQLSPGPVDVVVSGFNAGNNVSLDVLLSGTIGAALHGARNGIPSVAFSVHNSASGGDKAIASVTRAIVKAVPFAGLGRRDVLNVNFPLANYHDCDLHDHPEQPFGLQGIVETKLAPQVTGEDLVAEQRGHRNFYWNRRKTLRDPYGAGVSVDISTDIGALVAQFVSITVLDGQMRERKDTTLPGKIISQVEAGLGLDG